MVASAPSPAPTFTPGGGSGGSAYPTPALVTTGYLLASHFKRDSTSSLQRAANVSLCLEPQYETIVRTGLCYPAVQGAINIYTRAQSYQYDVQQNFDLSGNPTNSSLFLLAYLDAHCSTANYSGVVGSTVFNLNRCQPDINAENRQYYNVIYTFIPGAHPPTTRMPGASATVTGFQSPTACNNNFPVSSQVTYRDGVCIVDPGQSAPLGNAASTANSFRYRCASGIGCLVEYFSDHSCRHPLGSNWGGSINASTTLPANLNSQQLATCQANPVPIMVRLAHAAPPPPPPQSARRLAAAVPSKLPTRRPTTKPTAAPSSVPTSAAPTRPTPMPIFGEDDAADVPLFSYAQTVSYASTIKVALTYGTTGKQNEVPTGYMTATTYADSLCNPSAVVLEQIDAVGVCQQVEDEHGTLSSQMLMVGWDGKVAVRRVSQFADNHCIYEVSGITQPAVALNACIVTSKGSMSFGYSEGPSMPSSLTIRADVSSPVLRMYRNGYDCNNKASTTRMVALHNGDCVSMPGQGSVSFSCSMDGSQVTTTYFNDTSCRSVANIFGDPNSLTTDDAQAPSNVTMQLPNPVSMSAPSTCSSIPIKRTGPGTHAVFSAQCTSALYTQSAAHGVQGYVTTTYFSDARCSQAESSRSQAIGVCEAGIDPTSLQLISPSMRKTAVIVESQTSTATGEVFQKQLTISEVLYQDSICTAAAVIEPAVPPSAPVKTPTLVLDKCLPVPLTVGSSYLTDTDDIVAKDKKAFLALELSATPSIRTTGKPSARAPLPPKRYQRTTYSPGARLPNPLDGYTIDSFGTIRSCLDPADGPGKIVTQRVVYASGACVLDTDAQATHSIASRGSKRYSCSPTESGYSLELFSDYACSVPVPVPGVQVKGAASSALSSFPPACSASENPPTTATRYRTAYCHQKEVPRGYAVNNVYSSEGCTGPVSASVYAATGVCYQDYADGKPLPTSYMAAVSRMGGRTMMMRSSYSDANCTTSHIDPVYTEFTGLSHTPPLLGLGQCAEAEGNPGMSQMLSFFRGPAVPYPLVGRTVTGYTKNQHCQAGADVTSVVTYSPGACISSYSSTYDLNVGVTFSCSGQSTVFQSPTCTGKQLYSSSSSRATCAPMGSTGTVSDLTGAAQPSAQDDNEEAFSSEFCSAEASINPGFLATTLFLGASCETVIRAQVDTAGQCLQKFNLDGSSAGSYIYVVNSDSAQYTRVLLEYSDDACSVLMAETEDAPVPLNVCVDTRDGQSAIATYISGTAAPPPFIHGVQTNAYAQNATCQSSADLGPGAGPAPILAVVEPAGVCLPYTGLPGPWRQADRAGGVATPHRGYEPWSTHSYITARDGGRGGPHHHDARAAPAARLWVTFDCSDGGVLFPSYTMTIYNDSTCTLQAPLAQVALVDPSVTANPLSQPFDQCVDNRPPPPMAMPLIVGPVIPSSGPMAGAFKNLSQNWPHRFPPLSSLLSQWLGGAGGGGAAPLPPPRLDNSADFDSQTCSRPPSTPSLEFRGFAKRLFLRSNFDNEFCSYGENSDAMSQTVTQLNTCYTDLVSESNDGSVGSFMYMAAEVEPAGSNSSAPLALTLFVARYVDPNCIVPVTLGVNPPAAPSGSGGSIYLHPALAGGTGSSGAGAFGLFGPGFSPGALLYSGPSGACIPNALVSSSHSYSLLTETINLGSNQPVSIAQGVSVATFSTKGSCEDPDALADSLSVFPVNKCLPVYTDGVVTSSMIYGCQESNQPLIGGNETFKDGTYTVTTYTDLDCVDEDVSQTMALATMCEPDLNLATSLGLGSSTLYRVIQCYPVATPTPAPTAPSARPSRQPSNRPSSRRPSPAPSRKAKLTAEPSLGKLGANTPSHSAKLPTPKPSAKPSQVGGSGLILSSFDGQGDTQSGMTANTQAMIAILVLLSALFAASCKYYAHLRGKTVFKMLTETRDRIPSAVHQTAPAAVGNMNRPSEFSSVSPIHTTGNIRTRKVTFGSTKEEGDAEAPTEPPRLQRPENDHDGVELANMTGQARL